MDSRFSCNICLDPVEEPVVTQCGHLYCWPCLFRWLEPGMTLTERQSLQLSSTSLMETTHDPTRRHCPVCKASCCVSNLIPIYVRASGTTTAAEASEVAAAAAMTTEKHLAQQHSRNNLSEIDDKHSSSSTIATEQEEDEDDGEPIGAPLLDTASASGPLEAAAAGPLAVSDAPLLRHDSMEAAPVVVVEDSGVAPPAAALGALQRQRRASPTTTPSFPLSATLIVPNRPSSVSLRPRAFSENAVGILQQQQEQSQQQQQQTDGTDGLSRTLAMSQGLAVALHRALQPTNSTNSAAQAAAAAAASVIPPLHRAEGFGNAAAMNSSLLQQESDPDATEFLSRILLMLASFVILCLLLF